MRFILLFAFGYRRDAKREFRHWSPCAGAYEVLGSHTEVFKKLTLHCGIGKDIRAFCAQNLGKSITECPVEET